MEVCILNEEEYTLFATKQKEYSYLQSINYRNFKGINNTFLYGVKIDNKVVASALIISNKLKLRSKELSIPGGILIDWNDTKLVNYFLSKLIKFAKQKKALYIEITPNSIYATYDRYGEQLTDYNPKLENIFTNCCFNHQGYNKGNSATNPQRWQYLKNINQYQDETDLLKSFDKNTIRYVKKALKLPIEIKFLTYDELPQFKELSEKSSIKQGFNDHSLAYYQRIFTEYQDNANFVLARLNIKEYLDLLNTNLDQLTKRKNKSKISENELNEIEKNEKIINNNINIANDYLLKGAYINLTANLYLDSGSDYIYLIGGNYEPINNLYASHLIQYKMMDYARLNNKETYNFYGISGYFDQEQEGYGVLKFKQGFNGMVNELVGTYTYINQKTKYKLYQSLKKLR